MQLTVSRTDSQLINATWLHSEQPDSLSQSLRGQSKTINKNSQFKIRSTILLKGSKFKFPVQDFVVSVSSTKIEMINQSHGNFPKIKFIAGLDSPDVDIGVGLPDMKTVESQILYTRLLFAINESESIVLSNQNATPLEIKIGQGFVTNLEEIEYRAKFFRKLRFVEKFFNTRFYLPNVISADEARILEVIYRGLTEGEFLVAAGDSVSIPNFQIQLDTLSKPPFSKYGEFNYKIESEEIALFGKYLPVGKISISIEKSGVANPRALRHLNDGDIIPQLKLAVFDYQIKHHFEKYADPNRLLKNKQKLNHFKNTLYQEESEFLVSLLDKPLTEITDRSAVEIIEGLLQFYDFPDRFSVLKPKLEEGQWRVPIALTYPKHESIWLEDVYVDVKTGKVEINTSFDELLKKGKMKAKEVFSFE